MNTVIILVTIAVALAAMYALYKSVQKDDTPEVKPKKDGKPVGDEPKELP